MGKQLATVPNSLLEKVQANMQPLASYALPPPPGPPIAVPAPRPAAPMVPYVPPPALATQPPTALAPSPLGFRPAPPSQTSLSFVPIPMPTANMPMQLSFVPPA